jgi:nitrogen fixation protein NifU and related proteins
LYGELILEHFRHPRNCGSLDAPDFAHEDLNPLCGDRVRIEVAMADDGTVREARFRGDLCMISKAASSLLTEMIIGSTIDSIRDFPQERLIDALQSEIRPARLNCVVLPLHVLKSAVKSK